MSISKLLGFFCATFLIIVYTPLNETYSENDTFKEALSKAEILIKKKNLPSLEESIKILEPVINDYPDNIEALTILSRAYVDTISIKTNALIVEKDEYKNILRELGKKADCYGSKAVALDPENKEALAAAAQGYGYYSASYGILQAILKGAAGRYKKLAKRLIKLDDSYMSGLGYKLMGRFYLMAPFPMGSFRKSAKYYKKALEKDNSSLESHYYLGMSYLKLKKNELARKEFEYVVNNSPNKYERHYIEEYIEAAKKELAR